MPVENKKTKPLPPFVPGGIKPTEQKLNPIPKSTSPKPTVRKVETSKSPSRASGQKINDSKRSSISPRNRKPPKAVSGAYSTI